MSLVKVPIAAMTAGAALTFSVNSCTFSLLPNGLLGTSEARTIEDRWNDRTGARRAMLLERTRDWRATRDIVRNLCVELPVAIRDWRDRD